LDFWPLNTCLFVRDFKGNDPRWVYRMLDQIDFAGFNSGSAQPSLNRNFLRSIPVRVPSLEEQRAIAEVLGALDDKIAANERVVSLCDVLAKTHFEAATSEQRARRLPLSSLARFINGRAFTKAATGSGRVVIRIAELNSGIGASTVYNDIDVAEDNLARPGDLLFAWSGSLTVARWFRPEAIVNQHIFKVVPVAGVAIWLINQALRAKLADFRSIAANKATTMGHIQRRHLDELVRVPAPGEVARLDGLMSSLWVRALAAEVETLQLAATRDELLPLLMSGRLHVKDAEKVVAEVV
jgi:type I restriction enzyme S subunit